MVYYLWYIAQSELAEKIQFRSYCKSKYTNEIPYLKAVCEIKNVKLPQATPLPPNNYIIRGRRQHSLVERTEATESPVPCVAHCYNVVRQVKCMRSYKSLVCKNRTTTLQVEIPIVLSLYFREISCVQKTSNSDHVTHKSPNIPGAM